MVAIIIVCVALVASLVIVIRIATYGGSVIKPDFRKALERINRGNMFSFLLENKFWYNSNIVGYYIILLMWISIVVTILCLILI